MKKKLSIFIYSLASGGAEKIVSILLKELEKKYDITLFLMNDIIFYEVPKNLKIIYLGNSQPLENGIIKLLKLPLLAWKYKKINNADISLSFMNRPNYVNILAKMMGMKSKVIISERSMPSLQHKSGMQGLINRVLIKFLYKKADVVIGNSKGNSNDLKNNFNIQNVSTIYNPIDLNTVRKLSKEKIVYKNDKFTFITVGRLDNGKNHRVIIEAMKNIDANLYIIGDGILRDSLEKQIKSLNLENKVVLLGKQSNPYKYLIQADCFVFSSLNEGFPNVLLESLACSLPIISTDCKSGPREILSPNIETNFQLKHDIEIAKYGILVPVNDTENLKKAMDSIIKDETKREYYKKISINRAISFDVEKIVKEFEDIINA